MITTPEHEAAFRADWALGMPLREMAALHGFRNLNSVTRAAKRLGLPARNGGRPCESPGNLEGRGRWVTGPNGVQVWEWGAA